MKRDIDDGLGLHDELELIEIGDGSDYGGTSPTTFSSQACIGGLFLFSVAACPTFKCSSQCGK